MKILLSNDDGVYAPGLLCLHDALVERGHQVVVVAPDRDRSGVSNSLTLSRPLRLIKTANGFFSVDGTPTDCVHVAITGWLDYEPDMVIAGINSGSNLGDDVLYSGTVAAATEGRFLGYPALAISLASEDNVYYQTAARMAQIFVEKLREHPLPADTVLNVNVPDKPLTEIKGFQVTRLGERHRAKPAMPMSDPRGRTVYWVGPAGSAQDAGPGTDFHAINNGYVSVTPLQVDLTRHSALEGLREWTKGLML